jgi:hypothetical protein
MCDGFLGHLSVTHTPDVAYAVEALNAVCTSHEYQCVVHGD